MPQTLTRMCGAGILAISIAGITASYMGYTLGSTGQVIAAAVGMAFCAILEWRAR